MPAPAATGVARTSAHWLTFQNLVVLAPLLVFFGIAIGLIATTSFPAPDELEHVSYAAHLREAGTILPEFGSQKTLSPTDLEQWDTRPNYIGHPSAYYLFIGNFLDRSLAPERAVLLPRLASLGLLSAGLMLALVTGVRSFEQDRMALAVFCIGLLLCPEILSITKQVTNDSLAVLGGALAYWGAGAQDRLRWRSSVGVAMGLVCALWAKPNAGLEIGVFLAALLALRGAGHIGLLAPAVAGSLIGSLPYLLIVRDYGAVVPVTAEGVWEVRHMADFKEYVPVFFSNIGYTWGLLKTGVWPITTNAGILTVAAFWAMMGCAAAGAWPTRRYLLDPRATMAAAGVIAFVLVLPIHLWFASAKLGYSIPAASFRYYLPLWPALIHALAWAVLTAPKPWHLALVISTASAALGLGLI